jgi:ribose 5-phosphate isomerase B
MLSSFLAKAGINRRSDRGGRDGIIPASFQKKLFDEGRDKMRVAVGCDHGGFSLKQAVLDAITAAGHEALDLGTNGPEPVDYSDFAQAVGQAILAGRAERGIVICGSGVGACIAANKMHGIYAAICHDTYSAHQGVEHDAMNVLCLGGRVIGPEVADELVRAFLAAKISNEERFVRRSQKMRKMEADGG